MENKSEHIKDSLLELLCVLQEFLESEMSNEVKKCRKHCDSLIELVGEYDASLKQE